MNEHELDVYTYLGTPVERHGKIWKPNYVLMRKAAEITEGVTIETRRRLIPPFLRRKVLYSLRGPHKTAINDCMTNYLNLRSEAEKGEFPATHAKVITLYREAQNRLPKRSSYWKQKAA